MKLKSKILNRGIGALGGAAFGLLVKTLKVDGRFIDTERDPRITGKPVGRIGVIWHETLLLPTILFGGYGGVTLISQSADGDIATAIAEHFGWRVVRGSSTRGGVTAVREILAAAGDNKIDIAMPADGPRGPRREIKDGLLFLAAKTGMPLMPMGVGLASPWRFKSWDRFAIPKPFHRACVVFGEDIVVPADADRDVYAACRIRVQEAMNQVTIQAEATVGNIALPAAEVAEAQTRRAA